MQPALPNNIDNNTTTNNNNHNNNKVTRRRKYNEEEATSIAFWIEEVIDEDLEFPEDIIASLRNGIDLCRLVNELQPGIVNIINEDDNVFAHTSNLKEFLRACQMFGVSSSDMFEVQDLLQNGDVQQVLRNIVALERAVVARGWNGPKLELEDRCEREDCANRIDNLLGEIGSLKRQLQEKDEDNRELRLENQEYVEKLMAKDAELSMVKMKAINLETSSSVLNEKYKLALIDIQIAKQEYESLQKQIEDKKPHATPPPVTPRANVLSPNSAPALINTYPPPTSSSSFITPDPTPSTEEIKPYRATTSFIVPSSKPAATPVTPRSISPDGSKKISALGGLGLFHKTASSPDLKKLEDMKKFIKKEKKELLRQEKEKKKKEDKEKEDKEKEDREKEREREKEKEKHERELQHERERLEKERHERELKEIQEKERHERDDLKPKLTRAFRSITQVKFIKHKPEKRLTSGKDKLQLDMKDMKDLKDVKEPEPSPRSRSEITINVDAKCPTQPVKPNPSPRSATAPRERSYTAAARLFSVFKPASTTEGTTSTSLPIA